MRAVAMPPSCDFWRISLSVLRAATQVVYLPRYGSDAISLTSLERSSDDLADALEFRNHVEVEERPRAGAVAGTAVDAEVPLSLGLPELVRNGPDRAGCRADTTSDAESLVDDVVHQVVVGCLRGLLREGHERL